MFTFTVHAIGSSRLFHDHREASALWFHLVSRVHGLSGLVWMPNHLHLDHPLSETGAIDAALRAFALWRHAHRGESGPVWAPRPPPQALSGPQHTRRNLRYLHLNPCRAGLAPCPVAWPWSTCRDCLGLVDRPMRPRVADPMRLHAYTSADPSCAVQGTPFPGHRDMAPRPDLDRLAGVVSEYLRVPIEDLGRRGPGRALFVGAARTLTAWRPADIARHVDLHRSAVGRAPGVEPRVAQRLARMLADDRFPGLVPADPRLGRRR